MILAIRLGGRQDPQHELPDLDRIIRPEGCRRVDQFIIHARPISASQVFDHPGPLFVGEEGGVATGDARAVELNIRIDEPAQDQRG
jgi:hypothetical protein